jgi:hypothetical protein
VLAHRCGRTDLSQGPPQNLRLSHNKRPATRPNGRILASPRDNFRPNAGHVAHRQCDSRSIFQHGRLLKKDIVNR